MMIRSAILLMAMAIATPATAATIIYSNDFDRENDGASQLNYASFNGLTVTGSVDLLHSGDVFGLSCTTLPGGCVDLSGSQGLSGRLTTNSFAFSANTLYTLTFDLSGNQRGSEADFFAGVDFDVDSIFNFYRIGGALGNADIFQGLSTTGASTSSSVGGSDPFRTYSIAFSIQNASNGRFFVGTDTNNNAGPILDNLSVTGAIASVPGVPEPTTWAMMIAGFGLIGGAMRRRQTVRAAYA